MNEQYLVADKKTLEAVDIIVQKYDLQLRYDYKNEQIFSGEYLIVSKNKEYLFICFLSDNPEVRKDVEKIISSYRNQPNKIQKILKKIKKYIRKYYKKE